jgi:hypothetical protein
LGETAENGTGDNTIVRRSSGPASARVGDIQGKQ